jgi:rhamnosyl/mannosyltransferase
MEVLHLYRYCEQDSYGGIERHLSILCECLAPEVRSVLLVSSKGFYREEKEMPWGKIIKTPTLGEWKSADFNPTLPFELKKNNSDIIHIHLPFPGAVLAYLLSREKRKMIVSFHMESAKYLFLQKIFSPFVRKIFEKANAILVNSPPVLQHAAALKPFLQKCHVIPYGIHLADFAAAPAVLSESNAVKEKYKQPLILYAGRLVWYKGIEFLIKAMKGIDAVLLIVGDGPQRKNLKKLAAEEKIKDKIIFIGKVPSMAPYHYASEFLVLPSISRSESFGMVQLEAMACGKPVISTELGTGSSWVNRDEVTGIVVKPQDLTGLQNAINLLLSNPSLRKRLGENGKAIIEKNFTDEKMAEKILQIYKDAAKI